MLGMQQKSIEQILYTLFQRKHMVDPSAAEIMQKKPELFINTPAREVNLVVTSLRSLGLTDGVEYKDIFAAADKAGLILCPPEVGPLLRLNYDQPFEETLVVGMQPIEDNDDLPSVFTVHHWEWGQALGADCCGMSNVEDDWHADSDWIFMIP